MDFLPENINHYTEDHTSSESALLARINRDTHAKVLQPRMLSGHLQGRILATFSQMIRPKRVLEIGTYTGYSALCFAEGLADDGIIHTIDINEELENRIQGYFHESGFDDKIKLHIGNALEIVPLLKETWDLVFIDADKENYIRYYEMVMERIRPGGFIIADNVLWSGKVLNDPDSLDLDTRTLVEFNNVVQDDQRVENVLFPVRDGLMVCRKI
jgi:caffeoyl-CoA O-methyltransferase